MKKLFFLILTLISIQTFPMKRGREEESNGSSHKKSTGAELQSLRYASIAVDEDIDQQIRRFNLSPDDNNIEKMQVANGIARMYQSKSNTEQARRWFDVAFNLGSSYAAHEIAVSYSQNQPLLKKLYELFAQFLYAIESGLPVQNLYKDFKDAILSQFIDHEAPSKERINQILATLENHLAQPSTPAEKDFTDEILQSIKSIRITLRAS